MIGGMSLANSLWGAPRIQGELLKLGIEIGQTSVAKYMARGRRGPSQGWRTFLCNHADGIASMDLFVVPTLSFRLLYGFLVLRHHRTFRGLNKHGHFQLSGGLGHCLQCNEVRDIRVTDRKLLTSGVARCLAEGYHVLSISRCSLAVTAIGLGAAECGLALHMSLSGNSSPAPMHGQ